MQPAAANYNFASFHLDTGRRLLLREGQTVALSARAYDILQLLIENRTRVVTREEIFTHVWPGITVEASNLTVQISTLRRALDDADGPPRIIATVPGRGYRFIAALGEPASIPASPARPRRRWRAAAGGVLLLAAAGGVAILLRPPAAAPPRLSIVVLPFRNLSDEAGKDYLADAVTDDLTTELAHLPGSLVIARASADIYKLHPAPAIEIGRTLNVRYLLEGSVRAEGRVLRINAQLIGGSDGRHIWSDRFDASTTSLLEARTEITHRIARALDVATVRAETDRAELERPNNPDALDNFFKARSLLNGSGSLADLTAAQTLLEKVVAAQPDFAGALAALGNTLVLKMQGYDYAGAAQDLARAQAVIGHALAIAPHDPDVLAASGRLLSSGGQCAEAEAAFDEALAADPAHIAALWGQAYCAWRRGAVDKVIPSLAATLRLDPEGPASDRRLRLLGLATLFAGRPAEALPILLHAQTADAGANPDADNPSQAEHTRLFLIAATALAGDPQGAARAMLSYRAQFPRRSLFHHTALFTPAQSGLPYYASIATALRTAGLPDALPEDGDQGQPMSQSTLPESEFGAAPATLPDGSVVRTAALKAQLSGTDPPLIADIGRRLAIIPGSLLLEGDEPGLDRAALQARPAGPHLERAHNIVVMGTGPAGTSSYNMAIHLIKLGYRHVGWYRGGEEAWAAAGLKAEDRRDQ